MQLDMTSMQDSIAKFGKGVMRMERGLPANQVQHLAFCTPVVPTACRCVTSHAVLLLLIFGGQQGLKLSTLQSCNGFVQTC